MLGELMKSSILLVFHRRCFMNMATGHYFYVICLLLISNLGTRAVGHLSIYHVKVHLLLVSGEKSICTQMSK